MPPMSGQHSNGDSVNLSSRGLYLPSWSIGLAVAAIIFVVSLAVESRLRLGVHEQQILDLRTQLERQQAAVDEVTRELRESIHKLQVGVAAICAATNARCP